MIAQFVGDPSFTAVLMVGVLLTFVCATAAGFYYAYEESKRIRQTEKKDEKAN
jgi:hypothetical protein